MSLLNCLALLLFMDHIFDPQLKSMWLSFVTMQANIPLLESQ